MNHKKLRQTDNGRKKKIALFSLWTRYGYVCWSEKWFYGHYNWLCGSNKENILLVLKLKTILFLSSKCSSLFLFSARNLILRHSQYCEVSESFFSFCSFCSLCFFFSFCSFCSYSSEGWAFKSRNRGTRTYAATIWWHVAAKRILNHQHTKYGLICPLK